MESQPDPDPDLEALVAQQRRFGARRAWRFCAASFGIAVIGGVVSIGGTTLEAWQSPSPIKLWLPWLMAWGGFGGACCAALLGVLSAIIAIRLRLRRGL